MLDVEIELRRNIESVAAQRRALPLGGKLPQDYTFVKQPQGQNSRNVRLSELFADGRDTLIIYSFMFGPKMERA